MKNGISILLLLSFFYHKGSTQTTIIGEKAKSFNYFSYKATGYSTNTSGVKGLGFFPIDIEVHVNCSTNDTVLCDYIILEKGKFKEAYIDSFKYTHFENDIMKTRIKKNALVSTNKPIPTRFVLKSKDIIKPNLNSNPKDEITHDAKDDIGILKLVRTDITDSIKALVEIAYTLTDSILQKVNVVVDQKNGPETQSYLFSDWRHYKDKSYFEVMSREVFDLWQDNLLIYYDAKNISHQKSNILQFIDYKLLALLDSNNDTTYISDYNKRFIILNFSHLGCPTCVLQAREWKKVYSDLDKLDSEVIYIDKDQLYSDKPDLRDVVSNCPFPIRYLGKKYRYLEKIKAPTIVVYDLKKNEISFYVLGYLSENAPNVIQHIKSVLNK